MLVSLTVTGNEDGDSKRQDEMFVARVNLIKYILTYRKMQVKIWS